MTSSSILCLYFELVHCKYFCHFKNTVRIGFASPFKWMSGVFIKFAKLKVLERCKLWCKVYGVKYVWRFIYATWVPLILRCFSAYRWSWKWNHASIPILSLSLIPPLLRIQPLLRTPMVWVGYPYSLNLARGRCFVLVSSITTFMCVSVFVGECLLLCFICWLSLWRNLVTNLMVSKLCHHRSKILGSQRWRTEDFKLRNSFPPVKGYSVKDQIALDVFCWTLGQWFISHGPLGRIKDMDLTPCIRHFIFKVQGRETGPGGERERGNIYIYQRT